VQQVIDAAQCVCDAELLREDVLRLFGSQSTDSIAGGGLGQKPTPEHFVLGRGQFAGPPRLPLGTEALQVVIAIVVYPALYEPPTAVHDASNLRSVVAFESQKHGEVAVSLLGVTLPAAALT
jgi:hypothetical protein